MRVALSEGRLSKWEQLLDEIDPRQFRILEAYYRIEPWGPARDDVRQAVMTAVLVKAMNGAEVDIDKLADYLAKPESQHIISPQAAAELMERALRGKKACPS